MAYAGTVAAGLHKLGGPFVWHTRVRVAVNTGTP
jgi:hypothetical protein